MQTFIRILQLRALPASSNLGLFVLRVWLGLSLLLLHGWGKILTFSQIVATFPDPLGVGSRVSLALAIFAEVVCAALLVVGLFGRLAALAGAFAMSAAFFITHQGKFSGEGNGELAFIYLAGFITLFLAGPGRFSVDRLSESSGKSE